MQKLRSVLGLLALAALCLVPVACSDSSDPTSSGAGARQSTGSDTKSPTLVSADSAIAPPCRENTGTTGSGNRC